MNKTKGKKMRNRAKCKKCGSIIESFHQTDYVMCKCGEISVDGGNALKCAAKDYSNFVRVDDDGNEIVVKVLKGDGKAQEDDEKVSEYEKPQRKELIEMLDEMIKNIEKMPQHAMSGPINHYDYASLLILLSSIFRCED